MKYSDGREMKFTDIAEQVDLAVSACETVKPFISDNEAFAEIESIQNYLASIARSLEEMWKTFNGRKEVSK